MSLINSGFDGTVTERDFSRILRGAGVRDSVETAAAWNVTQGTGRQVSVAPGVAYAAGVVSDSALAILAALPTPVNGQWHLVVRRINWASNTVTVATIPHTTTTTTIPTAPPAGFPAFNDNTGVLVDQLLAWAWVRSTDTTVAVFDLRSLPPARGFDLPVLNVAALPTVGNFAGRQVATLDTNQTFRWSGSAWQLSGGAFPSYRQSLAATFTAAATNSQQEVTGLRIDAVGAPAGRYLFQAHLSVGDTAANEGEVRFRIDEVSINAGEPNRATAATISPYDLGDVFTFGGGTLRVRVFVSRTAGTRTILSAGRSFVSATYLGPS